MMNAMIGVEGQCPIHPHLGTCCLQLSGVQEMYTDTHMLHAMCADHVCTPVHPSMFLLPCSKQAALVLADTKTATTPGTK